MESFKFNDIKIESPYDIVFVLDIKMNHGVNIHSTLYLKLICEEYDDFQIFIKTNTKDFIKLSKFDNVIFNGLIESLEVSRQGNLYTLEIKAISATSLLDSKVETRSFQDINMLYSSVISTTISNIPQTIFAFNLMDKKIQEPLVQYNETAWEFLKRLASHFNNVLVCDIKDNKPRFYFGFNKKSTISIPQDLFYKANKDIESLNLSMEQLMDTDLFYHEVKTKEMYDLQDEVYFKNKKLYISHIKAEFIKSELIFTYRFSRINGVRQNKIYNENIKGASLEGKVIDSKDEFVKLHLNIDKKQDKTTAHWFKVGPISNNVFYLMFEKDTFARLYFPSNKEVEAEVKNSVRKNGSTCSLTKVPQNRYLTTKNNNQMSLKPSSIEFKSNTNLQLGILLEDPMGAKFYSHKNIKFDAVNDIRFYTKKNINIIALVSIKICVISSVSSLFIQNEFDIKANVVFYLGRDRAYFEKFNDDPVIATNKFSIGKLIFGVVVGITVAACIGLCVAAVTALTVTAALGSISAVALPGIIFRAGLDVWSQENSSVEDYIFEAVLGCALGGTSQVVQAGMKAKRVADVGLRIGQVGSKIKNSKYVANAGKHIISAGKQIKNSKFIVNTSKKLAQCGNKIKKSKYISKLCDNLKQSRALMDKIDDIKNINKIDLLKKVTKDATEKFVEGLSLAFTDQTFRNAEIKDGKFSIDYDLDAMKDTSIRNTILLKGVDFMQLGKFKLQNTNTGIYTRARYSGASKYIKSENMDEVLKVSMEQGFYLADVVIQYINSDNEQSQDTIDSSEKTKDVSITEKTDEKDVSITEKTDEKDVSITEKTDEKDVSITEKTDEKDVSITEKTDEKNIKSKNTKESKDEDKKQFNNN